MDCVAANAPLNNTIVPVLQLHHNTAIRHPLSLILLPLHASRRNHKIPHPINQRLPNRQPPFLSEPKLKNIHILPLHAQRKPRPPRRLRINKHLRRTPLPRPHKCLVHHNAHTVDFNPVIWKLGLEPAEDAQEVVFGEGTGGLWGGVAVRFDCVGYFGPGMGGGVEVAGVYCGYYGAAEGFEVGGYFFFGGDGWVQGLGGCFSGCGFGFTAILFSGLLLIAVLVMIVLVRAL